MKKRNPRPRPPNVADPMQPRVFQEPAAPDDPVRPDTPSPDGKPGPSGAAAADAPPDPLPTALPAPAEPPPPSPEPAPPVSSAVPVGADPVLEDRLHRLEEMIVGLKAHAVTATPPALAGPSAADVLAGASQALLPLAAQALQAAPVQSFVRREGSLLFEIYAEVRCAVRMYMDPRYRLSWSTRVVPLAALGCMFFSWFWLSGMVLLGPILDRLAFATLLYIVFKVLGREALHYRMTSPDLPDSLRL